jgi:hypothetical protein
MEQFSRYRISSRIIKVYFSSRCDLFPFRCTLHIEGLTALEVTMRIEAKDAIKDEGE